MFTKDALAIDPLATARRIEDALQTQVRRQLRRHGVVLGLSGGIDSAVVAGLCARALGPERVLALLMPERDSSPDSLRLGRMVADNLGLESLVEDVGPTLEAIGCYRRQLEAIRTVFPTFDEGWQCKLTLPSLMEGERLSISRLTVRSPDGEERSARMPGEAYLQLVAATNFKQRVRKTMEYYHADRLVYAVAGTPNRLEYDQGFFVKAGDGAADVKPIAHLYKTQVYALAEWMGLPEEVSSRPPTTDTFSMEQTQEEFFFSVPWEHLDMCLYAHDHQVPEEEVAHVLDLAPEQVTRVYRDIERKRRAARYLHSPPLRI